MRKGFELIELLIVLTIGVIIATMLIPAVGRANRFAELAEQGLKPGNSVMVVKTEQYVVIMEVAVTRANQQGERALCRNDAGNEAWFFLKELDWGQPEFGDSERRLPVSDFGWDWQ